MRLPEEATEGQPDSHAESIIDGIQARRADLARRWAAIWADPHPGLSSWCEAADRVEDGIRAELAQQSELMLASVRERLP